MSFSSQHLGRDIIGYGIYSSKVVLNSRTLSNTFHESWKRDWLLSLISFRINFFCQCGTWWAYLHTVGGAVTRIQLFKLESNPQRGDSVALQSLNACIDPEDCCQPSLYSNRNRKWPSRCGPACVNRGAFSLRSCRTLHHTEVLIPGTLWNVCGLLDHYHTCEVGQQQPLVAEDRELLYSAWRGSPAEMPVVLLPKTTRGPRLQQNFRHHFPPWWTQLEDG